MEKGKNTILLIIILATVFGLASGAVGAIVARVYILENALNVPLFGEIDFSSTSFNGSNLVIRDAKKVVVQQNDKVAETLNSVKNNIVGIYEKSATSSSEQDMAGIIENAYNLDEELGQAFILTSDGWIVTSFIPDELKGDNGQKAVTKTSLIAKEYVVLSNDRNIYEVDEIIVDPKTNYSFWHIKADGLPVKKFINRQEVSNGDIVISVNWDGWTWISSIIDKSHGEKGPIMDSDLPSGLFKLEDEPTEEFYGSFLFNLNGDVLAMINQDGQVEPIYNYTACINCLLRSSEIKRPSLGVYYIDLSKYLIPHDEDLSGGALIMKNEQGIAVKKNSSAEKAGLKEGDMIVAVDNVKLGKDVSLSNLISQYQVDDAISIEYERDGERKTISLVLGDIVPN